MILSLYACTFNALYGAHNLGMKYLVSCISMSHISTKHLYCQEKIVFYNNVIIYHEKVQH